MTRDLSGVRVAILAADGVERIELEQPRGALHGAGAAAICHGPWTLITAGVVRGRRLTSWPSLRDDLRNAGAEPVDEQVVVDGQFTTSRSPADLPAFCPAIVEQFAGRRVPS
jgi:protease I